MANPESAFREQLARVLDWEDAHVSFDKAVADLPAGAPGARAGGFAHTPWQLVEHLRLAQDDILEFCQNVDYRHTMQWPDDYWPAAAGPASEQAWNDSIAGYTRSREALKRLAHEVDDLTATVPTGKAGQTYLRAILLAADHAAYHVGQIVAVRRALGVWPD